MGLHVFPIPISPPMGLSFLLFFSAILAEFSHGIQFIRLEGTVAWLLERSQSLQPVPQSVLGQLHEARKEPHSLLMVIVTPLKTHEV